MVSQLQFQRMRPQVGLLLEVGLVVFAYIMIEQGDGHNQREVALMKIFDDFQQFLLFVRGNIFLEIAHQVMEYIGVLFQCGFAFECFHEQLGVLCTEFSGGYRFGLRH